MSVTARRADPGELELCFQVRRTVFVEEQRVPADLEVDGQDERCDHFLAFVDGALAGTARLRITSDGHAKAERVAVLAAFRGRRAGHALMDVLEARAQELGHSEVVLSAQKTAVSFYLARRYQSYGPELMEAGIPHQKMRLLL